MKEKRKKRIRQSLEGVTVNGIPLISFLKNEPVFDEERREIEEVKKEKVFTYKKPVIRTKTKAEKNGKVKRLMTEELNAKNYVSYMTKFAKSGDLRSSAIVSLLCSKKIMTCADLADEIHAIWKQLDTIKPWSQSSINSIRTYIGQFKRSGLNEFLFVSKKKAGVPTTYGMTEEGYNLTLNEALNLSMEKEGSKLAKEYREYKMVDNPEKSTLPKEEKEINFSGLTATAESFKETKKFFPNIKVEFMGPITIEKIVIYTSETKDEFNQDDMKESMEEKS